MKQRRMILLYSLVPIAAWLGFELVIGVLFQTLWGMGMLGPAFLEQWSYIAGGLSNGAILILGLFWYPKIVQVPVLSDKGLTPGGSSARTHRQWKFGGCGVLGVLCMGIWFQAVVGMALELFYRLLPSAMESYTKVMENLGITRPGILSVIYVVVLAPLAEELIFRGMCFGILRKGFSFWTANIIQALLFGFVHGNLVQGCYAFLLGMILGFLREKYDTLWASILLHFVINLSGQAKGLLPGNPSLLVISTLGMAGLFLFTRFAERKKNRV